jgi:WD40 repeat protein
MESQASYDLMRASDHSGQLVGTIKRETNGVAFSPDGRLLAVAVGVCEQRIRPIQTGEIVLVDIAAGKIVARWVAHSGGTTVVAFWDDGRTLLSSGLDGTVRFWDVAEVLEHHTSAE